MSVSIHLFTLLEAPGNPHIKKSYPVGNTFTHSTHQVIPCGGVYFCTAGCATAVNKVIKLCDPHIPVRHGILSYNLKDSMVVFTSIYMMPVPQW